MISLTTQNSIESKTKMNNQKKRLVKSLTGQSILDAMPEVAYVFNKDNQLVMWNKKCEVALEYTAEELYLKNIYEFVEENTIDENFNAISNIFTNQTEQIIEQNLVTKSGKKIPILDTANYAVVGGEEYLIGLSIDISQLKETQNQLQGVIQELQELKEQLQAENIYLREEYKGYYSYDNIIGKSETLMQSISKIEKVAPTNSTVLLYGETGTDKELFARIIHNKSQRKEKPIIMANCSSSSTLITELELFGHEKGAFEGALEKRIGKIELAHQGTLYLYEIGELTLELQSKLLSVVNEGKFERIGSSKTRSVDIRIIASTKHNLEDLIRKQLFREDLYYSINMYPITIAPLRDRIGDIPLLAKSFVQRFNSKLGKNIERISKKTLLEMQRYSWPGNVRELENVIERAVIISTGTLLKVEPFLEVIKDDDNDNLLPLAEYEKRYILMVLQKTFWRIDGPKGAAQILDMHPETLRSRMRKLSIKRPSI